MRPHGESLLDRGSLVLLAVLVAVFFAPALALRGVYFYADAATYSALLAHTGEWLRAGDFPLWNPLLSLGGPHAASPVTMGFYPPQILLALLMGGSAYGYLVALHVLIAATATFAFARVLGLTRPAALVSAIAYGFSGFAFAHLQHLNIVVAASWIPAVFVTAERYVATGERRFLGLAMLAVGLLILGGHPQIVLYGLTGVAAYCACLLIGRPRRGEERRSGGTPAGLFALAVFGLALAAVFLLPFVEWMRFVARDERISADYAVWYSLPPHRLVGMVAPFWFGGSLDRPGGSSRLVEWSGYVGVLPLALAPLALVRPSRSVLFLFGLGLTAFLLALGGNTPVYRLLLALPLFSSVRVPARFLVLAGLAVALLAGFGLDNLRSGRGRDRARLLGLILAGLGAALVSLAFRGARTGFGLPRRPDPVAFDQTDTQLLLVALGGSAILLFLLAKGCSRPLLGCTLAFVAADLYAFQSQLGFNGLAPPDAFEEPSANATAIRSDGPPPRYLTQSGKELESLVFDAPDLEGYRLAMRESLRPGLSMGFGLQSLTGYQSEPPVHERLMSVITKRTGFDSRAAQVAGVFGVRYLIASPYRKVSGPELTLLRSGVRDLFRNEAALPRAYLVPKSRLVANEGAAFAVVKRRDFDPRQTVVIETPGPSLPGGPLATTEVLIADEGPDRVVLDTRAEGPSWLVLNDTYAPGWTATIDGTPTATYRANGLVRAVALGAGPHRTVFTYAPASVRWGALVSLCALLVASTLVFLPGKRRSTHLDEPDRLTA